MKLTMSTFCGNCYLVLQFGNAWKGYNHILERKTYSLGECMLPFPVTSEATSSEDDTFRCAVAEARGLRRLSLTTVAAPQNSITHDPAESPALSTEALNNKNNKNNNHTQNDKSHTRISDCIKGSGMRCSIIILRHRDLSGHCKLCVIYPLLTPEPIHHHYHAIESLQRHPTFGNTPPTIHEITFI